MAETLPHDENTDSAVEDGDADSTTSLSPSVTNYPEYHGRTYHAFDQGIYPFPNDELEKDRLDLQHHLFHLTFGTLQTSPIPKGSCHRALDIGTGTGIWAIDFADEHPEAIVYGVDLSAIQPRWVPSNVRFQIWNIETDWGFESKFDFIHSRMMTASIMVWPKLFQNAYDNLAPGGYLEVADICFPVQCDDNTLPPDSHLLKWSILIRDACEASGRPCDSAMKYEAQMEMAGFTTVTKKIYRWPQNGWPRNSEEKILGLWNLENMGCYDSLFGFTIALFTRHLDWTVSEVVVLLAKVRSEMADRRIHAYWNIYVVYGQKPQVPVVM